MFWDTSAIVPLLVDEPVTTAVRDRARSGPGMVVWWGTSVECASAIARLEREHALDAAATDVARGLLDDHVVPGAYVAHPNLEQIPLGRVGLAQELANTYAFLSSEDASYITGQTFHVNGGEIRY